VSPRPDRDTAAEERFLRLADGFLTTQLLYVAAALDLGALLADGPRSVGELAAATGVEAGALRRVLRGLCPDDVLVELDGDQFALGPLGSFLVTRRGAALVRGGLYFTGAGGLLDAIKEGATPFERVHRDSFFAYLDRHPHHQSDFELSMAGRAEREAAAVVAAHDFSGAGRIVDVGGGRGVLLAAILCTSPATTGVLFDREAAVEAGRRHLDAAGVGDRVDGVVGDFFEEVPAGADTYVLSRVLHDWDDADAVRILATCREAMTPASQLLVVDAILPERACDRPAAIRMDLHMLVLFGSRERTEQELRALLERGGFVVEGVAITDSPAGLGIVRGRLR
jgi:predicted O-methyltransferase YrrM